MINLIKIQWQVQGGHGPCGVDGLSRQVCFKNFVCQNKRIGTLRGA